MDKQQKKELIKRYIVAGILVVVTIIVLAGMFKQAAIDDAAMAEQNTQTLSEQMAE